ncbi:SMI1/KNR4 family protein [Chitinophaga terrae (ex Kim and Jung 2007)]|nr:SMI1/KNR4 family protein [Chitinophaga terrae (ex Kim and Jung 2007)]GEP88782.1 SMI1/KNR4 family protein [Chitinophaga terrae (ex Kim and Jung 2007)]
MSTIVDQFLKGLKERLPEEDNEDLSYAVGATDEEIARLKERYPQTPDSLVYLLKQINGTYHQQYGDRKIAVLMLGSDVGEYPYYLKSVDQILKEKMYNESIRERYDTYFDEISELVGEGIDPDVPVQSWLHFSDCMNNGGTSSLYIDFNPAPGGTPGQIVRFLHDPDSYKVIAPSFDQYLQDLVDKDYDFILEEDEDDFY